MKRLFIYLSRIPYYLRFLNSKIYYKLKLFRLNNRKNEYIFNEFFIEKKLQELKHNGICTLKLKEILDNKKEIEVIDFIKDIQSKQKKTFEKEFLDNFIGGDFLTNRNFKFNLNNPLYELAINPTLITIVRKYFNHPCKLIDIQLAKTKVIKEKNGRVYSQRWHKDPSQIGVIKIFIYFSNVTSDSGPFEYLEHTHYRYKNKNTPRSKRIIGGSFYPKEQLIDNYIEHNEKDKKCLTGKKGTIIIADTSGFHRGGFSRKRSRTMSTFAYYPKFDPIKSRIKASKKDKKIISNLQREFIT